MRLLFLAGLLAAGCVVPKDAGFTDVNKLVGARGVARLHWNQGGPDDEKAAAAVRDLLAKDLTVGSATEIALLNNRQLQATYERLGVAQAELVQAGLLRNPSLSGAVAFPIGAGQLGWSVSLVQDFLDAFLIPVRKRLARAELERVKLEVGDAVLELAAEVRAAFYIVQAGTHVIQMRQTVADAAKASAELAQRQHDAGNLSDLDLANEQGLYAQVRLDLARAGLQLQLDRERLTRLLGVWGSGTAWKVSASLPPLPASDPLLEHVETFAVEHRLDLAALRAALQLAGSALSLTKAGRYFGAVELGGLYDKSVEGFHSIGPSLRLELPIFDQGQARVARARSLMRQSQRLLEAAAIDIRSEVRTARLRVYAARAMVDYYQATLLPLRERTVALSQQNYNAMLLGAYQLIAAKQNQINTYRDYIESVRDYWIARSDLERVAGGPIPEPGEKQ